MVGSIATIVAALISAGIALIALILSKENKVSEFRQEWIDGLRADVSSLIGTAAGLGMTPMTGADFRSLNLRIEEYRCRIALRFKDGDTDAEGLIDAVNGLIEIALLKEAPGGVAFQLKTAVLQAITQSILKNEWERVKRGEPVYIRTLKLIRVTSIVLGALLIIYLAGTLLIWPLFTYLPQLFKG